MSLSDCARIQRCPICSGTSLETVFIYSAPPNGEISFLFSNDGKYYREYLQCNFCHHFVSSYQMDLNVLYKGDYVASNYKDIEGVHSTFKRIISLVPGESDNERRTVRINKFARKHFNGEFISRALLDIGSGLGVFPYAMKRSGWKCTALDPDAIAVEHLTDFINVRTVQGDFSKKMDLGTFDVVTLNKVLEHIKDPLEMLSRVREHVVSNGFVYVEVPDGEAAANEGCEREEFFIDHLHVFSAVSLSLLVSKSGFELKFMERIREPSSKYTLYAFMVPGLK
jgi:hypothetical protein